jgi:hypothetical protein
MREYEVSEEEAGKGFVGNFGRLQIEEQEDGLYTINAYKVEKALKNHPIRRRPVARTPNWGHPILRAIKKGVQFETLEEAQAELQKLQVEYPETTVPATNKLFLMIFSRREDPSNPIKKYVLEITNLQGGGFTIGCTANEYKPSTRAAAPEEPVTDGAKKAKPGHFASMVKMKQRKGKK